MICNPPSFAAPSDELHWNAGWSEISPYVGTFHLEGVRTMKTLALAFGLAILAFASSARAQAYIGYMPAAPAVAYYAPAPVVGYGPVVATSYYAPQVAYYAAPAPYVVASPVVTTAYYAPAPVAVAPVYGPAVVVRPKVYIYGQPVRNVLRAVTP
jgi:hypothetical protein